MVEIIKDYAAKRLELLKLSATERGVVTAGTLTFLIMVAIFTVFFLILFNIGIAILIGTALDNYAYGFLVVAGFYLLLLILTIVFGKAIKDMIANKLLNTFNNPTHE